MTTNNENPVAYSYLRFSKPEQALGTSQERQDRFRDAWLKRNPHVRFDETLTLRDKGVSGFRGDHRKNKKHDLAKFIDLVERGRVRPGDYLIVENLDRLTRENPLESIPAILSLINAGLKIVQLDPFECVYDSAMDTGKIMMMLGELARGHGESKRKSGIYSDQWKKKKKDAREGKPKGPGAPKWIELADGKYRLKQPAAKVVKRIFTLCIGGLGTLAITRVLNEEGVTPIGRVGKWWRSYVEKILNNRSAIGEYQPMTGKNATEKDGEPIPNYYPPVVTEAEWFAAHAAIQARNKRSGRPARRGDYIGPFSGLLKCGVNQCSLYVIKRKGKRSLVNAKAFNSEEGALWTTFPLEPFNAAILSQLEELKSAELFADPSGSKLTELNGRLLDCEKRLNAAMAQFDKDPESPTWSAKVTSCDREKRALVKELREVERESSNPLSSTWSEALALMQAKEPERLRATLLQTIDSIWCVFGLRKQDRIAAAQVFFKGGGRRFYVVYHAAGHHQGKLQREPSVSVKSVPGLIGKEPIDLRNESDAKRMLAYLSTVSE